MFLGLFRGISKAEFGERERQTERERDYQKQKVKTIFILFAGYGVRTHAHLCAEDLKSSPLTSRANQLASQYMLYIFLILFAQLSLLRFILHT